MGEGDAGGEAVVDAWEDEDVFTGKKFSKTGGGRQGVEVGCGGSISLAVHVGSSVGLTIGV